MSYQRVCPRDLFNEANLLKCLGRLSLLILDRVAPAGMELVHQDSVHGFEIEQNPNDGAIYCRNVELFHLGDYFTLMRPLNSREPWPLYFTVDDTTIYVFTEHGDLSPQLLSWAAKRLV